MTSLLALCCGCSLAQRASGSELEPIDAGVHEPDAEDDDEAAVHHDVMDASFADRAVMEPPEPTPYRDAAGLDAR